MAICVALPVPPIDQSCLPKTVTASIGTVYFGNAARTDFADYSVPVDWLTSLDDADETEIQKIRTWVNLKTSLPAITFTEGEDSGGNKYFSDGKGVLAFESSDLTQANFDFAQKCIKGLALKAWFKDDAGFMISYGNGGIDGILKLDVVYSERGTAQAIVGTFSFNHVEGGLKRIVSPI